MIKFCSPFTVYPNLEPIGSFYISLISILQGCFLSLILSESGGVRLVEESLNLDLMADGKEGILILRVPLNPDL